MTRFLGQNRPTGQPYRVESCPSGLVLIPRTKGYLAVIPSINGRYGENGQPDKSGQTRPVRKSRTRRVCPDFLNQSEAVQRWAGGNVRSNSSKSRQEATAANRRRQINQVDKRSERGEAERAERPRRGTCVRGRSESGTQCRRSEEICNGVASSTKGACE